MKMPLCSLKNGARQMHWLRIVSFSAVAPIAVTLATVLLGVVTGSESMKWPWGTGVFWMMTSVSWGAFAGGLYRAAQSGRIDEQQQTTPSDCHPAN